MQVTEKVSSQTPLVYLQSTPSVNIFVVQLLFVRFFFFFFEITSIQTLQRIKHVFIFHYQQQTRSPSEKSRTPFLFLFGQGVGGGMGGD